MTTNTLVQLRASDIYEAVRNDEADICHPCKDTTTTLKIIFHEEFEYLCEEDFVRELRRNMSRLKHMLRMLHIDFRLL